MGHKDSILAAEKRHLPYACAISSGVLARIQIGWTHLIEKDTRRFNKLEWDFGEKPMPIFSHPALEDRLSAKVYAVLRLNDAQSF